MDTDHWYYTDGENSIGPFTEERLRAFHTAGVVLADTRVCRGADAEWIPFIELFQFTERSTGDRSPLAVTRPETIPPHGPKLVTAFVSLVVLGITCLVLPLKWAPVTVCLVTPIMFLAAIVIGHLIAARSHAHFLGLAGKKTARRCAGPLYFLFCICSCAVLLIVLDLADARPVYLRDGWRGIDVSQPAAFSWAILRADVKVNVPSDPVLQPSEQQAAEKMARLIAAKNKLWLIIRMKLARASTAHQFALVLGEAANGFTLLSEWPDFNVGDSDTDERLFAALVRMTQDSNAETARETQVCTAALATDIQRFGSDLEVQQAMPQFLAALNPPNALSGLAAVLRDLAAALSNPADTEQIELARKSVEAAISSLDPSMELKPKLRELLGEALDRSADLKASEKRDDGLSSPYYQSVAAAKNAATLLSAYPSSLLLQRHSGAAAVHSGPPVASSTEVTFLDRSTLQQYFGTDGYLPKLGDDLERVANRAGAKVTHCSDHNYVTADSLRAMGEGLCTFTAVGTGQSIDAVVIYAPQVIDQHEHDLVPLADRIRSALAPIAFRQVASTKFIDAWTSDDQQFVVFVRKFPTSQLEGKTYYGSSNVIFGDAVGAKLITDNNYVIRAPHPATETNVASTPGQTGRDSDHVHAGTAEMLALLPKAAETEFAPARRLAKEGTFFLLQYTSVKTARGVFGFEPGHEVHLVRNANDKGTVLVTDGKCELEVSPSLLTNDIDVATTLSRAEAATQQQILSLERNWNAAAAAKQHQLDVDHARDVQETEKRRVQSSRIRATPNLLDQ